jgi:murein DD-endopeptidase MepM/ murein hydrolase activator NlpD
MRFLAASLLALVGLGASRTVSQLEAEARSPFPVERTPPYRSHWQDLDEMRLGALGAHPVPVALEVRRGQTLSELFGDLGLDRREATAAVDAVTAHLDPRRLQAGNRYLAFLSTEDTVERVVFPLSARGRVWIERAGGRWESRFDPYRIETREMRVEGALDGALEASLRVAGAPPALAYRLADVFQWDLDFNRDLRVGDRFQVLFSTEWVEGALHRVGPIRAAVYENQGQRYEAYRFGEEGGYYDAEGRPLRKQFLRSPLPFTRVTSSFTNRRFHPVLKVYRAHHGVDFGAPTGTPVRVTASGTVALAAWTSGGGGKTVKVRHPGDYETAYLHLSRYAEGVAPGRRVRQGDVIGYVGATGLATAPHLDYRVKHRGRYLDPMRLGSVPAPPLSAGELARFETARDGLRAQLVASPPSDWAARGIAAAGGPHAGP